MSVRARLAGTVFTLYKRGISPAIHAVGVGQCIFLPTCSEYAHGAIVKHGWLRGTRMALARLARCHPWGKGGHDPVP
jgi:putative membrane protein insertion efficiency factor